MARAPARKKEPGLDLDGALAAIHAGNPSAVYLLDGDPFLTQRGGRSIAEALVPEERRSLNLVELDAAASPAEVAAELATGGLFGGGKVVIVAEPAFLQSKEDLASAFARASDIWREGRQREAARRLVALAARFGWSTADLCGDSPPPIDEWERKLQPDEGLRPEDGTFVRDAGRFAGEKNLQAAKDDVSALEALLERGLPPGCVLVIAAGKVDGRLPVVKRIAEAGCRITLSVKSEGTWDAKRPVLGPMLAEMLAGTDKSVNPDAEDRLAALVGTDARALAAEVAKLAAFVGDRREIGIADVDAVVVRTASDPFFALGNAVEARDLAGALGVLRRGLADGASPHMWVGSLAGTIRRMLVEQERGRLASGGKRLATFGDWSATVLPGIDPEELGDRKPYGLWMKYQAAVRFTRSELLDCLASLAEADHSMKTGSDGAVLVERCLVGLLRAPDRERRIA